MSQKTPVKTVTKDILARCMATENIRVEHRADAPSAYFDVENRVLGLPVWKDMDSALYDMLVGHEVSHALHTPAEGWQEFVGNSGTRHMFVNVVEDARIERMIKDKFPGLRRDFVEAYKSLHDRDLFEISGKDLSTLPLIDRLNLHFKIGLFGLESVPFTADEQQYVTRMAETTTFEEVVELARELYEMYKEEQDEQEQNEQEQESGQQSPGAGDGEGEGSGSTPSDSDESGEGDESGASASDEGDEESSGASSGNSESGEDSGASMEDDTDDGESAESTTGESGESGDGEGSESELSYEDYENNVDAAGATQRNFEKGVENMRDESSRGFKYSTLPTANLDDIVILPSQIAELWNEYNERFDKSDRHSDSKNHRQEQYAENATELNQFLQSIKGTVNGMVQQFQMKQAADADKRTSIAKTGVLDTCKMVNYRWSEDIFLKNEVHAEGKNHGIIMYLDWSGSMTGILEDTVKQMLVLVEFCRKVSIPFEVYAFSSNRYFPELENRTDRYDYYENNKLNQWKKTAETNLAPHEFALYNFLSSKLNKREWNEALNNFWNTAMGCRHYRAYIPGCLTLGCTPLNEAIMTSLVQIPAFQQEHGIQIVNAVYLSDGDGHGIGASTWGHDGSVIHSNGRDYRLPNTQRPETDALLNIVKKETGANTIGIRLHDSKHIRNMRWGYWNDDNEFAEAAKQYKKENFTTSNTTGYDEQFIIKGNTKVETDTLGDLTEDASYAKIKNAFIKGGNNKKSSRVIANRLIDIIAA